MITILKMKQFNFNRFCFLSHIFRFHPSLKPLFLLFFLFCFSCSPKQEIIESTHPDGSPLLTGIYWDSVKVAEIKYYDDGKKEMEGSYNKSLERHGKWTYWYTDGKVWSECEYKNGLKDGKSTVYYENGSKRYEGNYRNDTTTGVWKFWNEQGALLKEINY